MTTRLSRGKVSPELSQPYQAGMCWRRTGELKYCPRIPVYEYRLTRKVINGNNNNRPYVRVWLCETCADIIARSGYEVTRVTLLKSMTE
jgi:hypothetical protein